MHMVANEKASGSKPALDWNSLGFGYTPVNSHIRHTWADGKWSEGELRGEHSITMSIAACCLHYGQAAFEGLKAFTCKDGKVRIFRPDENADRLNKTAHHLLGPEIPKKMFIESVRRVVADNIEFVPPYGTGGSLYIRPLYIGTSPQIGVAPSTTYELLIMAMPVGAYYKGGMKPVDALVIEDYDRAAPKGTGSVKVAGNYAASFMPSKIAKTKGFSITLFLDPKNHEHIDEFGTSNFFAITKDGTYITPDSPSILSSITNKSLQQIARDCGLKVEKRPIHKSELSDLVEVGACGTAVVITPISSISIEGKTINYGDKYPTLKKLYERITGIQYGELPDTHGWMYEV